MSQEQIHVVLVDGEQEITPEFLQKVAQEVQNRSATPFPECVTCTADGCKQCAHNELEQESAVSMLEEAAHCIGDRASERDTEAERSMAATIRAFNGMYGTELTEEQGWQFMVLLKMARAKGGDYRRDDYVDGAAYFALAGECRNDCT